MIRTRFRRSRRPGTILPLLALTVIGLFTFLALAIDLGMLAVARTECQNAADAAALTATRTLDNKPTSSDSNKGDADTFGRDVVVKNVLFASNFQGANVQNVRFGTYDYNTTLKRFETQYPSAPPVGRSWTATEVTVTSTQPSFFGGAFALVPLSSGGPAQSVPTLSTGAVAVAVYRPRDLAVVMDLTGSMRFGTTLTANGAFLSADPLYPQFGHYARYPNYAANNPNTGTNGGTTEAGRHNPFFTTAPFVLGSGELYAPNNYTVPTAGGPACVKDFYYDPGNLGSPATPDVVIAPNMAVANPPAPPATDPNGDDTNPPTPLPRAFHHWNRPRLSPGNPDAYVAPTYDYSGWAGIYDPNNFVQYPMPETFDDQSHPGYVGDLYPRKGGQESVAANRTASWDPLTPTGAAVNLAEYLGWTAAITPGASTPNPSAGTNMPAVPTVAPGRTWANFRDATWEQYGYDLDVAKYITDRGTQDPRTALATTGSPKATLKDTAARFKGYSVGPGYWGKTFFVWPPDPRSPVGNPGDAGYVAGDWRRRFFTKTDGTAFDPQADNDAVKVGSDGINEALLRDGGGSALLSRAENQSGTPLPAAGINYVAVLKWVKQKPLAVSPNLRAGRVLYYSSIPDDVDTASGSADQKLDKAFWKGYIDYVLCNYLAQQVRSSYCPTDFENNGWPNGATPGVFQGDLTSLTPDPRPYMHYLDNPSRPRSQFWFGPVTMMAYLGRGNSNGANAWAGTTHESQAWQLKAGMNSVLDDIRSNHPNDSVGIAYFSYGAYGNVSVALGQEWKLLKSALFYPQAMLNSGDVFDPTKEYRPFDLANNYIGGGNIPNAQGGTDPNTGLAMAYNILSPGTPVALLPPLPNSPGNVNPLAPRNGRRGATKIVLFETDGVPNAYRDVTFNAQGYNSHYTVTGGGASVGNGNSAAMDPAYAVVDQIVADAVPANGLSTPTSKARVYAIGFGDLFSTPSATFQPQARDFLLNIQKHGKTSARGLPYDDGPAATAIPASQIITGPYQTRIDSLKTCFERIMQAGVQVTLVE